MGHTVNPIQFLLTGQGLKGATATADSNAFKVRLRQASGHDRYLFLDLDIAKQARPGKYRFRLAGPSGTAPFDFTLDPPLRTTEALLFCVFPL